MVYCTPQLMMFHPHFLPSTTESSSTGCTEFFLGLSLFWSASFCIMKIFLKFCCSNLIFLKNWLHLTRLTVTLVYTYVLCFLGLHLCITSLSSHIQRIFEKTLLIHISVNAFWGYSLSKSHSLGLWRTELRVLLTIYCDRAHNIGSEFCCNFLLTFCY